MIFSGWVVPSETHVNMRITESFNQFNHSQRHALDASRCLAVRASAGSGKTSVLVERIVQMLARSWDERRPLKLMSLVALTFTRKAAAELQGRLRDAFRQMRAQATDPREKTYWKEQADDLPRAMVGTIDSFCGRILREFGFLDDSAQRVEPDFEPLDEYDTMVLRHEAIDRVINRLSGVPEGSAAAEAEACRWWAIEQGYDLLTRSLYALLGQLVDPEIIVAAHRNLEPADRRVATSWASLPAVRQLHEERADLRRDVEQMVSIIEQRGDDATQTLLNLHKELIVILDNIEAEDAEHDRRVFEALTEALLTQKGEPRKLDIYRAVGDIMGPLQEVWHPLLKSFEFDAEAERHALEAADRLALLLGCVHEEYLQLCREANRFDFTTLARRVRALLQHPEVCRQLKQRFHHVMVDEFQDTNQLQWEIIARVVGAGPDGLLDDNRLFIVGDPQQSIYRFRQADVGVFRRVRERIRASNQHHGHAERPTHYDGLEQSQPSTPDQRLGLMPLGENYRSLTPMPLALMDRVFAYVFDSGVHQLDPARYPFEVEYQPLIAGRSGTESGEVRYVIPAEENDDDDSADKVEDDKDVATEGLGTLQVRAVIDQLVALHGQRRIIRRKDEDAGAARTFAFSWRDMAVLLPSRTMVLTQLEAELRERGVPFVVSGGIGFWQRQEVSDVINLVAFLADRGDELALFAVLRGPLGQRSDTEILFLSQVGLGSLWRGLRYVMQIGDTLQAPMPAPDDGEPDWLVEHWQRLPAPVQMALQEFWAPYPASKKQRLRDTARLLVTWRRRADRMAHADLLQRALEESGAYAIYAGETDGAMMLANLELLFDHIRAEESRAAPDLNRLARRLRDLRDDVDKQQQATLARDTDAVQIMTVHAAKGLEFPVVAVMKMDRKAVRGARSGLMVKSPWDDFLAPDVAAFAAVKPGTIAVSVRHPQQPRGDRYKPQLLLALRRLDEAQELAESRRLFYVAATRAQERLILAGRQVPPLKDGAAGKVPLSWQLWFEQALHITEAHKESGRWQDQATGQSVNIITSLDRRPHAPREEAPHAEREVCGTDIDLSYVHERPLHPMVATTSLDEMRELWRGDRPGWWLRYRLQLRPHVQTASSYLAGDDAQPASIGTVVGSMIHRLLEMPDTTLTEPPEKLRPLLEAMAANLLAASAIDTEAAAEEPDDDPVQVQLIVKIVEGILDRLRAHWGEVGEFIKLVKANGEVEVPFALRLKRWLISGRFDKLLRREQGFEVVDWKTDADADAAAIVERHRPQMKLYALALSRAGLAAPVDSAIRVHLALLKHLTVETLSFTPTELEQFEIELSDELEEMSAFEEVGAGGPT